MLPPGLRSLSVRLIDSIVGLCAQVGKHALALVEKGCISSHKCVEKPKSSGAGTEARLWSTLSFKMWCRSAGSRRDIVLLQGELFREKT